MRKLKLEELGRPSVEEFKKQVKIPLVVVLDNIRSMQNVGSIFRTSDAFAVEKIVLCGITAQPPHRDIHRSALGATESVDWEYVKDSLSAINQLKDDGYKIVALEQTDNGIVMERHEFPFTPDGRYALVLGNEVEGVSDEVMDVVDLALEIPQRGTKHSLNVSVAAGISIWWFHDKLSRE